MLNLMYIVYDINSSNSNTDYLAAESDIKEGLVKAARDTKGWLFTSGVNHVSL